MNTTPTRTLVLIACSQNKRAHRCPARELYAASQLFRAARQYAEREGDAWLIVSARHGLVEPATELDPYDQRPAAGREARRAWSFRLQADVARWLGEHPEHVQNGRIVGLRVVVLAGREYVAALQGTALGRLIEQPLQGLQIGQRLAWLAKANRQPPARDEVKRGPARQRLLGFAA